MPVGKLPSKFSDEPKLKSLKRTPFEELFKKKKSKKSLVLGGK